MRVYIPKMSTAPRYDAFVITAPGLELLAATEMHALGLMDARPVDGGVSCSASRAELYAANLNLRTASRVVVRAGEFGAKAFHELERRAAKVPWEAFVSPNLPVSLRVTCRKSRLYHSDAVAERVAPRPRVGGRAPVAHRDALSLTVLPAAFALLPIASVARSATV